MPQNDNAAIAAAAIKVFMLSSLFRTPPPDFHKFE
jgi:hypothetical protein